MWPALLVAAAAGSSFLAKKILDQNPTEPISGFTESDSKCDNLEKTHTQCDKDSSFACNIGFSIQEQSEGIFDESIFRFSSASGSEIGCKNLRKINEECSRRKTKRNGGGGKLRIKCGNVKGGDRKVPRIYVCLKKRRTNKFPSGKCDSCASKGNSIFGWGLGIGMMCMMSAGKSEISRLNTSMNETTKVVQELKAEVSRRRNAQDLHASRNKVETNERNTSECGSSVVTEEQQQQPEAMEMDQLEAELQLELQKLPWCADLDGERDPCKNDNFLEKDFNRADDRNAETYQFGGVLPSELEQKLCHLLIEQQESQIVELESELRQTHSKLNEKDAELQALKDCVRRLTEFSLTSASGVSPDEGTDGKVEDDISVCGDQNKKVGPESRKSILGMKRSMNF